MENSSDVVSTKALSYLVKTKRTKVPNKTN